MLGALYMGWYPEHWRYNWVVGSVNPYMKHPVLGNYNSSDVSIIKQHVAQARRAGIEFFVFDWFGPRGPHPATDESYIDRNFRVIANQLAIEKFPFCLMVDQVFWDITGEWLPYSLSDLQVYFNNPYYYKINGAPVCYLWSTRLRVDNWNFPAPILTRHIGDLVHDEITPGFDDTPAGGTRIVDRQGGTFYQSRLAAVYTSALNDAVVYTWNDYGESDFIEPTQEYGEQYLDITKNHLIQMGAYRQSASPDLLLGNAGPLLLASGALLGIWLLLD